MLFNWFRMCGQQRHNITSYWDEVSRWFRKIFSTRSLNISFFFTDFKSLHAVQNIKFSALNSPARNFWKICLPAGLDMRLSNPVVGSDQASSSLAVTETGAAKWREGEEVNQNIFSSCSYLISDWKIGRIKKSLSCFFSWNSSQRDCQSCLKSSGLVCPPGSAWRSPHQRPRYSCRRPAQRDWSQLSPPNWPPTWDCVQPISLPTVDHALLALLELSRAYQVSRCLSVSLCRLSW